MKRQLISDTLYRVTDSKFATTNCRAGSDFELSKLLLNFFPTMTRTIARKRSSPKLSILWKMGKVPNGSFEKCCLTQLRLIEVERNYRAGVRRCRKEIYACNALLLASTFDAESYKISQYTQTSEYVESYYYNYNRLT